MCVSGDAWVLVVVVVVVVVVVAGVEQYVLVWLRHCMSKTNPINNGIPY